VGGDRRNSFKHESLSQCSLVPLEDADPILVVLLTPHSVLQHSKGTPTWHLAMTCRSLTSGLALVLYAFCRKEHIMAILTVRGLGFTSRRMIFQQGFHHALESPDSEDGNTLFAEIDVPAVVSCF